MIPFVSFHPLVSSHVQQSGPDLHHNRAPQLSSRLHVSATTTVAVDGQLLHLQAPLCHLLHIHVRRRLRFRVARGRDFLLALGSLTSASLATAAQPTAPAASASVAASVRQIPIRVGFCSRVAQHLHRRATFAGSFGWSRRLLSASSVLFYNFRRFALRLHGCLLLTKRARARLPHEIDTSVAAASAFDFLWLIQRLFIRSGLLMQSLIGPEGARAQLPHEIDTGVAAAPAIDFLQHLRPIIKVSVLRLI
mmetsp:Transcript_15574/g.27663  ORF Transcript_15574/g.27663 Transcript_15574/m.27663 type:complete len:250 (-) Transcript_15574:3487-4236(-)